MLDTDIVRALLNHLWISKLSFVALPNFCLHIFHAKIKQKTTYFHYYERTFVFCLEYGSFCRYILHYIILV